MKMSMTFFTKLVSSFIWVAVCFVSLVSCDSVIYDDLPPCEINQKLKFVSDYNMLGVDAFNKYVSSVYVVAFDKSGKAAWTYSESGDALKADGYAINLASTGCPPGTHTFVAWCGIDNRHLGATAESFDVPDVVIGRTTIDELQCRLNRTRDDATGMSVSDRDLYPLYHGILRDVTLSRHDNLDDNLDEEFTMYLMKNTNSVRVILQNLSGENLNPDDFSYTIEESNGLMGFDNSLLPDETVVYKHWQRLGGMAEIDTDARAQSSVHVAIGDLTIARLMADRKSYLTIHNDRDNCVVARIPLSEYALLVKDRYTDTMSDQEYLDRQDQYALTFFLDRNLNWMSAEIYINSWHVMLDNVDFN